MSHTLTITITIDVPDGAAVKVGPAPAAPASAPSPTAGPPAAGAPDQPPDGNCPVHGYDWHYVPPGVSKKTGKPYNGFWACPERGCNERP